MVIFEEASLKFVCRTVDDTGYTMAEHVPGVYAILAQPRGTQNSNEYTIVHCGQSDIMGEKEAAVHPSRNDRMYTLHNYHSGFELSAERWRSHRFEAKYVLYINYREMKSIKIPSNIPKIEKGRPRGLKYRYENWLYYLFTPFDSRDGQPCEYGPAYRDGILQGNTCNVILNLKNIFHGTLERA